MAPDDHRTGYSQRCGEYLTLICVLSIRRSCGRPEIVSEVNHKSLIWLKSEIAAGERRLRAIEYEFQVKGWPLPDYEVWKRSGIYAGSLSKPRDD